MSTVVNKTTFQVIPLANTPDFPTTEWLINPVIPACDKKFWKLDADGETLREMTQPEKDELAYSTASTVYLIAEKQLITGKNGHDYEANANAIINPVMPACDLKYTKAVSGAVVEMTQAEKDIIDRPDKLRKWEMNVLIEIRAAYSQEEEISFLRQLSLGKVSKNDPEILAWEAVVSAAKVKYPKPT